MSFIEECASWDTSKWSSWGDALDDGKNYPDVVNGEWVMKIKANGGHDFFQAFRKEAVGYGRYRVKFRVSGANVSGVNWCPWLLYQDGNDAHYNELDLPEIWGSRSPKNLSVCLYRNTPNVWYKIWDAVNSYADGQYHEFKFDYLPDGITFWIDDVLEGHWIDHIPDPCCGFGDNKKRLIFYWGGWGTNNTSKDWLLYTKELQYTEAGSTPTPTLTYPTDRWQRIWANYPDGALLSETPDEPSIKFDNNWGTGAIVLGKIDKVQLDSSRTINLPTMGDYAFTLGSDDGSRLWIDDSPVIDNWKEQAYYVKSASKNLTAGNHRFRIAFYENGGAARLSFNYTEPAPPPHVDVPYIDIPYVDIPHSNVPPVDPCADYKVQIANLTALNAALQSSINTLNAEVAILNSQVRELSIEISQLKSKLDTIRATAVY